MIHWILKYSKLLISNNLESFLHSFLNPNPRKKFKQIPLPPPLSSISISHLLKLLDKRNRHENKTWATSLVDQRGEKHGWKSPRESWERRKAGTNGVEGNRANESRIGRLTSVTFVKPWPEPPGDTCNELINLIYRRLTEIQSQMRGTLIVRPLATDTIVYTTARTL